jgi:thiol-disulfide isomerase/thioredoxin
VITGDRPDGSEVTIGAPSSGPALVVFLAHWCPHCQVEVPVLVDLAATGALDDVRIVGVLTATNPDAPNHPPVAWLEREAWPGEIVLDDDQSTAGAAYGVAGYPFLVVLDDEGRVTARASGELPAAQVLALVDTARD